MSQAPVSATLPGSGDPGGDPKGRFGIKSILALATSVVAIATSVVSCQMKQAELHAKQADLKLKEQELAALKQEQADSVKARTASAQKEYLVSLSAADRLSQARILRFITAVETDERLCQWARDELGRLERTVQKETAAVTASVENLTEQASSQRGAKAEETQVVLAAKAADLERLKLAQSTIEAGMGGTPNPPISKPERRATKAECFAHCGPPARHCEAECNGDRACMKQRCFPAEAKCREVCLQGPPPG